MQGFYDSKGQYWKDVEDTVMLAACAPAGGDRQRVSARFTRHFALLCIPPPPPPAISAILTAVLSDFLGAAPRAVSGMGPALVAASVALFGRLTAELLPTPAKSHYAFNLRDLSSLFQASLACCRQAFRIKKSALEVHSRLSLGCNGQS